MDVSRITSLLFFALSLYSFGGGVVEGFQYSSWSTIPPAAFPAFHREIERDVQRFFVPFLLLSVPITMLLIKFHQPAMSKPLIVAAAVIQTYIVASTVVVAVPIQQKLGAAFSQPLLDRLIVYHTYFRLAPGFLHLAIVVTLLYQVLRKS